MTKLTFGMEEYTIGSLLHATSGVWWLSMASFAAETSLYFVVYFCLVVFAFYASSLLDGWALGMTSTCNIYHCGCVSVSLGKG